jgi:regulator of RNase E activity RraA
VKLVAKDAAPLAAGPRRHLGTAAIEAGGPGSVIVVEQRSGIDAGSWGGILSLAARQRGIEGVVADGSAVVFVRAADVERVVAAAERIAAREAAMAKAVLAGQPATAVMGADYEHLLAAGP